MTATDSAVRTRDVLWSDVEDVYAAILAHPFIAGLTDGTLPRESFRHYIVQDAHYLRGYAKALAVCAAKAPDEDATVMFAAHSAGAIAAQRDLHSALMGEMGSSPGEAAQEPIAPTTQAYVSYMLASALGGSFADAVGAVLPCYWIYARVGEELLTRSSPDPLYARWIAMYGSDDFQSVVDSVLTLTDRVGAGMSTSGCSGTPPTASRPGRCSGTLPSAVVEAVGDHDVQDEPDHRNHDRADECGAEPVHAERQPDPRGDVADQEEEQRVHHEPDEAEGQDVERTAHHLDDRLQHGVDHAEDQGDHDERDDPAAGVACGVVDARHEDGGHPQADRDHGHPDRESECVGHGGQSSSAWLTSVRSWGRMG
jgi:thiaminase (transcriptional activator TenA)